jgi:calcium-dependent protein kinase
VVKTAIHRKTKQVRAVKVIARKKIKNWDRFTTEVKILQTLDHPNIIKLYEYFEDPTNVYLITEMCSGGELFDKIVEKEFFDEAYACRVFKQILNAIVYCHKLEICHRDLKPENFLFDSKDENAEIKVIDFGLSKICYAKNTGKIERLTTKAGTPYYISPEVLAGNYDKQCDLWSAGCILYILLCGYPPFYGQDDQEILRNVQKGVFDFNGDEWEEVS